MKKICRYCTYYRPDARYQGVIGVCDAGMRAVCSVKDECDKFEEGPQRWLQGGEVKDAEQESGEGVRGSDEE